MSTITTSRRILILTTLAVLGITVASNVAKYNDGDALLFVHRRDEESFRELGSAQEAATAPPKSETAQHSEAEAATHADAETEAHPDETKAKKPPPKNDGDNGEKKEASEQAEAGDASGSSSSGGSGGGSTSSTSGSGTTKSKQGAGKKKPSGGGGGSSSSSSSSGGSSGGGGHSSKSSKTENIEPKRKSGMVLVAGAAVAGALWASSVLTTRVEVEEDAVTSQHPLHGAVSKRISIFQNLAGGLKNPLPRPQEETIELPEHPGNDYSVMV